MFLLSTRRIGSAGAAGQPQDAPSAWHPGRVFGSGKRRDRICPPPRLTPPGERCLAALRRPDTRTMTATTNLVAFVFVPVRTRGVEMSGCRCRSHYGVGEDPVTGPRRLATSACAQSSPDSVVPTKCSISGPTYRDTKLPLFPVAVASSRSCRVSTMSLIVLN
jgi:hypothetical protein